MRVLAGTSRGIWSLDEGSPRPVLESRPVRDLTVVDDRTLAGTEAGVFLSDDGGDTWAAAGLGDRQVWQIRSAGGPVACAVTQPAGLFRSDDGGASWTEVASFAAIPEASRWCLPTEPPGPGRARALVIDADDRDRIWVGVEVGGIARTDDGGVTWTVSLPGDNPDLHMLWAHPHDPDVLFASTGYGRFDGVAEMVEPNAGVFRSGDGGRSWTYAWAGITPRYSRPMCIDHRAPFGLTVASAPTAFSHHTEDGGAGAMLYRSDDEGASWRSLCDDAHTPSAANFHGLTTDPEVPGGVLVGTDTGEVWRVGDDAVWEAIGDGLPTVLSLAAAT